MQDWKERLEAEKKTPRCGNCREFDPDAIGSWTGDCKFNGEATVSSKPACPYHEHQSQNNNE